MAIFSQWWFWVLIVGVLGIIIGIILLLATDVASYIPIIMIVLAVLFILIGIIFWIRSARKPKQPQSLTQKFLTRTPGIAEMHYIGKKTGINNAATSLGRGSQSAGKSVGKGAKAVYGTRKDPRYTKSLKYAIAPVIGAVGTGIVSGPLAPLEALTPVGPLALVGGSLLTIPFGMYGKRRGEKKIQQTAAKTLKEQQLKEQQDFAMQQQNYAMQQQQLQLQLQQQQVAMNQQQIDEYNQLGQKLEQPYY